MSRQRGVPLRSREILFHFSGVAEAIFLSDQSLIPDLFPRVRTDLVENVDHPIPILQLGW